MRAANPSEKEILKTVQCATSAGAAVGGALGTFGLPFVRAAFGEAGLRIALLWDLGNVFAGALTFSHPEKALYQGTDAHSCVESQHREY